MTSLPPVFAEGRGRRFALVLGLGLAQALMLAVTAIATRQAFGALHLGASVPWPTLAALVIGGAGAAGLTLAAGIGAERLGQSYSLSLRRALYRHIAGMDPAELERRTLGGLSLRFVGDLSAARGWVGPGLTRGAAGMAVVPGAVAAMIWLNPVLAGAALIPVAIAALLGAMLAADLGPRHLRLRRQRARIASAMIERIAIAPALDLAGRTRHELARLDTAGELLTDNAAHREARAGLLRALPTLAAAISAAAVIWTATTRTLPTAEVAAMLAALSLLIHPLRDIAGMWDRWCGWRAARARCEALFARPSTARQIAARGRPVPLRVTNLPMPGGTVAARIGAGQVGVIDCQTGDGTALARVLAGLSASRQGHVSYGDGTDLPRVALVSETGPILRGSLRRCLTLGAAQRPPAAVIRAAARRYGLHMLVDQLGTTRGRIAEAGRDLHPQDRLAMTLTRASLIAPDLIIVQHPALAPGDPRLEMLHHDTGATMVIIQEHG